MELPLLIVKQKLSMIVTIHFIPKAFLCQQETWFYKSLYPLRLYHLFNFRLIRKATDKIANIQALTNEGQGQTQSSIFLKINHFLNIVFIDFFALWRSIA